MDEPKAPCGHSRESLVLAKRYTVRGGYDNLYRCKECGAKVWETQLPPGFWDGAPLFEYPGDGETWSNT